MYPEEERVFPHVGCLSLSGFDEISEAVFEDGTNLTEKAEQERKRSQECIRTYVTRIELRLTNWQGQAVSGSRNEEERELCLEVKTCVCVCVRERERERERVLGRREYI